MPEFISKYQGINYKIPETSKNAKFNQGRLSTNDEQTVSYLRQHQDYGSTLTEVGKSKPSMTVGVCFCPVEGCGRVFQSEAALRGHMKVHKGETNGEPAKENEGAGLNGGNAE